jgi:hypothetical protein
MSSQWKVGSLQLQLQILAVSWLLLGVVGECPNACSGRGSCSEFDICECWAGYTSSDCRDRICRFGLGWTDTPQGDLNYDNIISGPEFVAARNGQVYRYGSWEGYPNMRDSSLNELSNTAHQRVECSGVGDCNRVSGVCDCADGFWGDACEHVECGGEEYECSAHGTCHTQAQVRTAESRREIEGC